MGIAKQSCRLHTVCAHAGSSRRVVVLDDHQIDSIVSIIIVIAVFIAIVVTIFVIGKSSLYITRIAINVLFCLVRSGFL